jgi:hypothetical protein
MVTMWEAFPRISIYIYIYIYKTNHTVSTYSKTRVGVGSFLPPPQAELPLNSHAKYYNYDSSVDSCLCCVSLPNCRRNTQRYFEIGSALIPVCRATTATKRCAARTTIDVLDQIRIFISGRRCISKI